MTMIILDIDSLSDANLDKLHTLIWEEKKKRMEKKVKEMNLWIPPDIAEMAKKSKVEAIKTLRAYYYDENLSVMECKMVIDSLFF